MKRTKGERLSMVINAFRKRVGRPFTLDELATWSLDQNLWPTPGRTDPIEEVEAWEARFAAVASEADQTSSERARA